MVSLKDVFIVDLNEVAEVEEAVVSRRSVVNVVLLTGATVVLKVFVDAIVVSLVVANVDICG